MSRPKRSSRRSAPASSRQRATRETARPGSSCSWPIIRACGELFCLKWAHIDFERGFITIRGEEQEGAKSSRDERIPLTQPARELLAEIGSNDSAYVFPGRDGVSRMTDINKQVNAIKRAADLPEDFRPLHGLRHTFASVAVSHGVPLSHVQKLLTHMDPSLTQRYAHLEVSALKNFASLVGDFLEDVPGVVGER